MSIYSLLSRDVPTLAVVDWFTLPEGDKGKAALLAIKESVAALQTESRTIQKRWEEHLAEITTTSIQRMRGMLSQFLSTPLTSDNSEIQRILGEQVHYAAEQLLTTAGYGILGSVSGHIVGEGPLSAPLKQLADRGRRAIAGAVGKRAVAPAGLVERTVYVHGAANLDVLESLEDSWVHALGASAPLPAFRSLFELRMLRGGLTDTEILSQGVLLLEGPGIDTESLLAALSELEHSAGIGQWSLWQNRFQSREQMIRLGSTDRSVVKDAVRRLLHSRAATQRTTPYSKTGRLYFMEFHTSARPAE